MNTKGYQTLEGLAGWCSCKPLLAGDSSRENGWNPEILRRVSKGRGASKKARNELTSVLTGEIRIWLDADYDSHIEAPPIWDVALLRGRVEYGETHPEIQWQGRELNDFRNSLRYVDRQISGEPELLLGVGWLPTREPGSLDLGQEAERACGVPALARPLLVADVAATSPHQ